MRFWKAVGRGVLRLLGWVLMVALMLALLIGGATAYFYSQTGEDDLPGGEVSLGGAALEVNGLDWRVPVVGGVEKRIVRPETLEVQDLGRFLTGQPALVLPEDADEYTYVKLKLTDKSGSVAFEGDAADFAAFAFAANGEYRGQLRLGRRPAGRQTRGEYFYSFKFTIDMESEISLHSALVQQGDVVALRISGLPQGVQPVVETELGPGHFVARGGEMFAYIPVAYNREDGDYPITVTAGGSTETFTVTVQFRRFDKVQLAENTLSGTDAQQREYRDKIWPLFDTWDADVHWSGMFLEPVTLPYDAKVLSDYGWYEYIGGSTRPSRNIGITYACTPGSDVLAPAAGRVAFAGTLGMTDGMVVIEHGGGLKSYLYHLSEVRVREGDEVKAGALVGLAGELVQFDLKIGNQSVDPNRAIDGTGGIFWRG